MLISLALLLPTFHPTGIGPLLYTVLQLAVVGFVVWLIVTYIPMPDIFKKVLMVVVAIAVILWVMHGFNLL